MGTSVSYSWCGVRVCVPGVPMYMNAITCRTFVMLGVLSLHYCFNKEHTSALKIKGNSHSSIFPKPCHLF